MQLLQLEGDGAPHLGPWDFITEHFTRGNASAGPDDTSNRRVGLDVSWRIAGFGGARFYYQADVRGLAPPVRRRVSLRRGSRRRRRIRERARDRVAEDRVSLDGARRAHDRVHERGPRRRRSARSRRAGAVRRAAARRRSRRGSSSRGSRATRTRTVRASRSRARATGSRSFAIARGLLATRRDRRPPSTWSSTRAPSTSRTSRSCAATIATARRGPRDRVAAVKLVLVAGARTRVHAEPPAPYDYTIDPAPLYSKETAVGLVAGTWGAASVYAYFAWFRHATRTTDPMFTLEGFGVNTYAGGADKLGHFWAGHMFSYVTTEALVHGGFRTLPSSVVAFGLSSCSARSPSTRTRCTTSSSTATSSRTRRARCSTSCSRTGRSSIV